MLLSRMRLRSAVVSLQLSVSDFGLRTSSTRRTISDLPDWYSAGERLPIFPGSLAIYQSRCQSSRYWYAPRRKEPEPQAGGRGMRILEISFGLAFSVGAENFQPYQFAHGVFYDVINNSRRRIVDTALFDPTGIRPRLLP